MGASVQCSPQFRDTPTSRTGTPWGGLPVACPSLGPGRPQQRHAGETESFKPPPGKSEPACPGVLSAFTRRPENPVMRSRPHPGMAIWILRVPYGR